VVVLGTSWAVPLKFATFLASSSTILFPGMSMWLGIQMISILMPISLSFSSLSTAMHRIIWADCLSGFVVTLITGWLSVYILHF
jgi:hypothetical protein